MSGLRIKRAGKDRFAVYDAAGARLAGPLTLEGAQARMVALEAAERERRAADPDAQSRRRQKAAYREADKPGTELHALRKLIPRKGDIKKRTEAQYRGLDLFQGIDFALVEKGKQIYARHQAVAKASSANADKGSDTESRVVERWNALCDVPERKRAAVIARELQIDVRHVRRLRPR